MFTLTPDQEERLQIKSTMWAQLAEGFGARVDHPNRLQEFFALHDCIIAYESAELVDTFSVGMTRGAEFQERLMADNYHRGVVDTYRRVCAELTCPVPAWVETLAAEITERRAKLKAETQADRLQTVVTGEQVH